MSELLFERYAEFVEGLLQLRVDVVHGSPRLPLGGLGGGIIDDILKIYLRDVEMGPGRQLHRLPMAEGGQPVLGHPFGLLLLAGYEPDDLFVQSARNGLRIYIGCKTVLVLLFRNIAYYLIALFHA